jgi:hypothetical protein
MEEKDKTEVTEETPKEPEAPKAGEAAKEAPEAETPGEAPKAEEAAEKPSKKKVNRKAKAGLILALSVVLLAVIALGGVTVYYHLTFLPGTIIDGYSCGGVSAEDAADYLLNVAKSRSAQLTDAEGDAIGSLPLEPFADTEGFTAAVREFFDRQHAEAGLFGWMDPGEQVLDAAVYAVPEESEVSAVISDALYADTPREAPVSAHIVFGEDGYTVDPGSEGNLVDLPRCTGAVSAALPGIRDLRTESPVITVENGKLRQAVTTESEELLAQCAALDAYLGTSVTIAFQDSGYTLSPEEIWHISSVEFDGNDVVCTPVPDKVRELSDTLADQYALDGVYAKFRNTGKTRPYVYYRVGDNGWILDRDALAGDITAALGSGEDQTVELSYDMTWYWKEEYWYYSVGDTFVEISLDNQYLWFYEDGKLLVETPVVTGNISAGDNTRLGCFRVASMTTDTYLVGPTWNDHVDYWVPFDGQIGLHDSSWRDEYGGDIYLTDGSHGCINTPLEAMATIYDHLTVGTIVIVY